MATTERETETGGATRFVLSVTLTTGETIEAEAGSDRAAARDALASIHRRLDSESFVRVGDDAIVRSADVRSVRLRADGEDGGLLDTLKDKIGGRQMTGYDTEQQTVAQGRPGAPGMGAHAGGRDTGESGFTEQYLGYGRRPYAETKPFFMTSEFLAFLAGVGGVLIAAAVADNFDAPRAWLIAAIITAAYIVSRGIAKAGSRDPNPRGWGGPGGFGGAGWNR